MLTRILTLAAFLLLPAQLFSAGWIPLNPGEAPYSSPRVTVLSDDASATTLRIEIPGFAVGSVPAEGVTYQTLDLLTGASTNEPGSPELPCIPRMLAIPDGGGVTVEILETGAVQKFGGYLLPPARPSWQEGAPEPPYTISEARYGSASLYPTSAVTVDPPAVFRDFRVTRVAIYPIRYNARDQVVEAVGSMTVRISYGAGPSINPRLSPRHPIAPSFGALYRSVLANYQSVLERNYGGVESGSEVLLCIVPDTFVNSFQPYAEWKTRTGFTTVITRFSQIGATATNPDIIKNYILQTYTTWEDPPTYVLLVGDYGKVPRKQIQYDYTFAYEDFFVELEGDDYFPEMMIGRFTHNTDYLLQVLVSKAIRYEQAPYTANQSWFQKGVVCSNDNYESQIYTKRFAADLMKTAGGFTSVDTMMSKSPCLYNKTDVINAINNGRSFLNYRGEGWSDGWWASCTPLRTTDISTLNNGQMLTFVTSIGCGVAMFDVGSVNNCFGEEWLELGTPTAPRGAVAFVGPTSNTHTTYNNKIDMGIYMGMFQEGLETPAQALLRGKLYMYTVYGNEHWVEYHYRIYCVLGDPSLHIWKTVPRNISITYPAVIAIGFNQLEVTVRDSVSGTPVSGATVCLSGDSLMVTAVTDTSGRALVPLTLLAVDTLSLLVRGSSVIPAQGSIPVIADVEHVAPLGNGTVTDTDGNLDGRINPGEHGQILVTLKNWGTLPAENVSAIISSPDTTLVTVLTGSAVPFGTLAGGTSATGSPFQFFVQPACPVGTFVELDLHVNSSDRTWDYTLLFETMGCRLTCIGAIIDDQGSLLANSRLDPGETAIVKVSIGNVGEDPGPNVTGTLRSTDPYITIMDSSGSFGDVPIGGSAVSAADFFIVSVDDSCPQDYAAGFSLELRTQGGSYPYTTTRVLTIPVGRPLPSDPTGPDAGGYYAYSSDDSLYEQAPAYDWFDIGSLGTLIPRNSNGDFTLTVTLPFSFPYYDSVYTKVRISSDGWIAFGSGTQVSYSNQPLPNDDNVNCMVAAFWDDLFRASSDTAEHGRLLYYNDEANHRLIAQWDRVGHYSNGADRETFQIILNDPVYYPTASGKGEIVLQYNTVVETSSMTTGIENSAENVGLLYVYNETYNATASPLRGGFAIKFTTERPTYPSSTVSIDVGLSPGWNMLANPVSLPDSLSTVRNLYPTSLLDYVFGFEPASGYRQDSLIHSGPGYWGKFPAAGTQTITGMSVLRDTVALSAGWNMLGSISALVDTGMLVTIPPGLRSSIVYGYATGYFPTRYLIPGDGYWMKSSGAGQLIIKTGSRSFSPAPVTGTMIGDDVNSLTIIDDAGRTQALFFGEDTRNVAPQYVMPPLPPADGFDIRFETPEGGTLFRSHTGHSGEAGRWPILLQAAEYPLQITWEIVNGRTYELAGQTLHPGKGTLRVTGQTAGGLALVSSAGAETPREFALLQNYPNPFNPATTITFALPVKSRVTIEVYNLLGQRVRSLAGGEESAGYHTLHWDGKGESAQQLGSGVYFLRLEAVGDNGAAFTGVQKLVMMK
jgi:hypothetical protein